MEIKNYHAHVYYDKATKNAANQLHDEIKHHFDVTIGRWHDSPVGPHPKAMFTVIFDSHQFGPFVSWLQINRKGCNILVHPNTGTDLDDHTKHAIWLGNSLNLLLDKL